MWEYFQSSRPCWLLPPPHHLFHEIYHDHPQCHITCNDPTAWFGLICSLLGKMVPFPPWPCNFCHDDRRYLSTLPLPCPPTQPYIKSCPQPSMWYVPSSFPWDAPSTLPSCRVQKDGMPVSINCSVALSSCWTRSNCMKSHQQLPWNDPSLLPLHGWPFLWHCFGDRKNVIESFFDFS